MKDRVQREVERIKKIGEEGKGEEEGEGRGREGGEEGGEGLMMQHCRL